MTLVTDINAVSVSAVSGSVSPPSKCVLQPPFFFSFSGSSKLKLSWGTSAWGKQAALCPSDYSKQICGHKYDTLSSRWFMKSVLTAEFFCGACLRRRHVWSKPRSIRPIIGGRTAKPVTQIYVTNEERRDQPKNLTWTKNTHTPCTRLQQQRN